jgi:hypothetical protein
LGLGFLALFSSVLILQRLKLLILRGVTSIVIIVCLLTLQTATGVYIAIFLRWGSQWYLHSAVPTYTRFWLLIRKSLWPISARRKLHVAEPSDHGGVPSPNWSTCSFNPFLSSRMRPSFMAFQSLEKAG